MVVFRGALALFFSSPNLSPHCPQLVCIVEHEGGTRFTHAAPILLHCLFADGLERRDRLAPALWRCSQTLAGNATFRAVAFFFHHGPPSRPSPRSDETSRVFNYCGLTVRKSFANTLTSLSTVVMTFCIWDLGVIPTTPALCHVIPRIIVCLCNNATC